MSRILFAFVLFLLSVSTAFSDNWNNLVNELNKNIFSFDLTEAQRQEAKRLLKKYRDDLKEWWARRYKLNAEIVKSFASDFFDEERLKEEYLSSMMDKREINFDFLSNLHKLLDQKEREVILEKFHGVSRGLAD